MTISAPVLSEMQREVLASFGLTYELTDLCILILDGDDILTRVDAPDLWTWLRGYASGRRRSNP